MIPFVFQRNREIPNSATDLFHIQGCKSQLQRLGRHFALAVAVHWSQVHIALRCCSGRRFGIHPTTQPTDGLQPSFDS